jgi:hypothetical protein
VLNNGGNVENSKKETFLKSIDSISQVGVDLRDYFAIRYASALIRNIGLESLSSNSQKQVVRESYKFADIMLKMRENE